MVPEAEQPGRLSCKRGSACWTSSPRWSGEPKNDMQGPWAHWPKPPKIQLIWSYFVVAYRVVSYSGYVLGTGRESWPLILTYKLLVEVPSLATYRMILGTLWVIYIYIYIYWLVVSSPLTNMSSSAGMVTFPKPPTRQIPVLFWACIFAKNMFLRNYSPLKR